MGLFSLEKAGSATSVSLPKLNQVSRAEGKSIWAAYFNLFCLLAGTGMLGLPVALKQGGWISVILIPLAALFCVYCGKLQIECHYPRPDARLETYGDIGKEAFGMAGKIIVEIFSALVILGTCILYIIFIGKNVQGIANDYGFSMNVKYWMIITGAVVTIPVIVIRNLKEATFLGFFGALASILVVLMSCIMALIDIPNAAQKEITHNVVNWQGFPLTLTTLAFAYGANVVFPHLEHSMKHPQQFNKMIFLGMSTVALLYTFIAVVGYAVYGNDVKSPIMDSIPKGAANLAATLIITLHVVLASPIYMCSFALDFEAAFDINEEKYGSVMALVLRVGSRTFFGVLITVIAMYLPYFGDFMSFVGAISMSVLIFVIPVACHLKMFGFKGRSIYTYILMFLCCLLGVVCFVLGTIDSVKALIQDFKNDN